MQISPVNSQKLNKAYLILPSSLKIENKKNNTYFKSLFKNDKVENALNNIEKYTVVAGVPPGIPNKCEDNDKIPINKCLSLINDYDGSYGSWSSVQITEYNPPKASPEQLASIVECVNLNFLENFGGRLISSLNFGNDTQKLSFECTLIKGVLEGQVCVYNICKEPSEIYGLESENFIIGCFNNSAPPTPTPTRAPTNNNSSSSAEWVGGLVLTTVALLALFIGLRRIKNVLNLAAADKSNIHSPRSNSISSDSRLTLLSPIPRRRNYNGSIEGLQDDLYILQDNPSALFEEEETAHTSNRFTRFWGWLTGSAPWQTDTSSPEYDTL